MRFSSFLPFAAVLLIGALASSVTAEEAEPSPPPIEPQRVSRLLLEEDAAKRGQGEALLLERIRRGGDLAAFVREMAAALARLAADEDRMTRRWIRLSVEGTPEERAEAQRLLAIVGTRARGDVRTGRGDQAEAPQSAEIPPPAAALPHPARPPPSQPPADVARPAEPAPSVAAEDMSPRQPLSVRSLVVRVRDEELRAWLEGRIAKDADADGSAWRDVARELRRGGPVVRTGSLATVLYAGAPGLPEARILQREGPESWAGLRQLIRGETVTYRRGVRHTKKGAWAVSSDTISRGLSATLDVSAGPSDTVNLAIEVRNTSVALPLPALQVRPAPDVEAVELDRLEWEVSRAFAKAALATEGDAVVLFPGLLPRAVVIVAARVRTVAEPTTK